jgi:hypothetical protein
MIAAAFVVVAALAALTARAARLEERLPMPVLR